MAKTKKVLSLFLVALMTVFTVLSYVPAKAATTPKLAFVSKTAATYTQDQMISFSVKAANYTGKVMYRVMLSSGKNYINIWNTPKTGYYYTKWTPSGTTTFPIHWLASQLTPGYYSMTVLVKRVGSKAPYDSYVNTASFEVKSSEATISSIDDVKATVGQGEDYTLPKTVTAKMSDGTTAEKDVVWTPATIDTTKEGTYTFTGKVENWDKDVNLTLTVSPAVLLVGSVNAVSNNRVDVALTTAVKAVSANAFAIKDANGTALAVNNVALSLDGKTVKVYTAAQTANTLYTLTVAGKDYKFVGQLADATAPTLTSAVATSNTKVRLVFSEKVDENALNIANYTIAGLSVVKAAYYVDADGNAVENTIILTTSSQAQGTIYKVVVANVTDMSANVIDTDANSFQFGGLAADTTKPTVSSAVALTNTTVKVTFSEEMDEATAENIANYSIAGLSVLKAELSADANYVTLTTSAQTMGTIYKVVVANVKDASGNAIDATLTTNSFQFGGLAADTTKPTVVSAVALTNTTVKVLFSEKMDEATAESIGNYTIAGLTVTKAVLDSTSSSYVTLTTSAQTMGTIYKVVVANVKDASGNAIDATLTTNSFQFGGLAADTTKPTVVSATATAYNKVSVVFSEPVDSDYATLSYNYYLGSTLGYPTSVIMDTNDATGKTVILTTAPQKAVIYTVTVSGVADLSGNVIDSTATTCKATFGGIAAAAETTKPTVTSAVALDRNTVKVTFSEAMDPDTIANTDFVFAVVNGTESGTLVLAGKTATAIEVATDNKSVTLEFADTTAIMTQGVVYNVTVTGVKDAAGNDIDTTNSANVGLFAGISTVNPAPKVASAILVNNSTLKITFSEPVTVNGTFAGTDFALTTVQGTAFAASTFKSAVLSADGTYVTVYYNAPTFTEGSIYSVSVNTARFSDELDVAALSSVVVSGTTKENDAAFAGISATSSSPKIAAAIAVDVNTLDITFDQPVTSTLEIADITVNTTVPSHPVLVRIEGTDGNKIRAFFTGTPFTAGAVYTVTVDNAKVTNLNGVAMVAADNNALFAAISTPNAAPSVVSVTKVDATTLQVVFSEKITGLKADGSDFVIAGMTFTSAMDTNDKTGKTVTLTITGTPAPTAGIYKLTIAGTSAIMDEAGVGGVDTTSTASFVY